MRKLRFALIAIIVILGLAAFKTAMPAAEASKTCLLGYYAFCAFTPVSTVILALAAVGIFFAAKKVITRGPN